VYVPAVFITGFKVFAPETIFPPVVVQLKVVPAG
jgi:hypothetical protein